MPAAGTPQLSALDAPRWIASAHIVGSHFYAKAIPYFKTGGMWTQYFFIMSGFLLSYVEMARPPHKRSKTTQLQYLRKRLIVIYPIYMFSLVLLLFNLPNRSMFSWGVLPLHIFLLQAILPICRREPDWGIYSQCASGEYNNTCWFISVLIVYWLLIHPFTRIFERVSARSCYAWLAALWLWSWVPALLHRAELPQPWRGMMIDAMQTGPLGYLHVFVSGIVTARLFVLLSMHDASTDKPPLVTFEKLVLRADLAPFVFRFGCCIGYALWVCFNIAFFLVNPTGEHNLFYMFCHNGGIAPLIALVLLGGATGADPLANYVFQSKFFRSLGQLSYSQYLLQMPVGIFLAYYLIPDSPAAQERRFDFNPTKPAFLTSFFPLLVLCAYLAQRFIERPYTDWQRHRATSGILGADDKLIAKIEARIAARKRRLEAKAAGIDGDSSSDESSEASSDDESSTSDSSRDAS